MFVMLKVLRPKIVDEKFVKNLGKFLSNVQLIDAGSMQIQSATGLYLEFLFMLTTQDFNTMTFSSITWFLADIFLLNIDSFIFWCPTRWKYGWCCVKVLAEQKNLFIQYLQPLKPLFNIQRLLLITVLLLQTIFYHR